MNTQHLPPAIEILLVEDNPGDIELTQEALLESDLVHRTHVVRDGEEALDFLYRRAAFTEAVQPDVILLDLNMPRKNGQEVLSVIKEDAALKDIPVLILTGSAAERDIARSYKLRANGYIVKPLDLLQFPWWKGREKPAASPKDASQRGEQPITGTPQ